MQPKPSIPPRLPTEHRDAAPAPALSWQDVVALPAGLLGAIAGALLGGHGFNFLYSQGLHAPFLVGLLAAAGCLILARRGGWLLGLGTAVIALLGSLTAQFASGEEYASTSGVDHIGYKVLFFWLEFFRAPPQWWHPYSHLAGAVVALLVVGLARRSKRGRGERG